MLRIVRKNSSSIKEVKRKWLVFSHTMPAKGKDYLRHITVKDELIVGLLQILQNRRNSLLREPSPNWRSMFQPQGIVFKISHLLESTWSQIGQAPSLLRILLASSVPFCLVKKTLCKCINSFMQKKKNLKFETYSSKSITINYSRIHNRWPQVVVMARPSNSRQHALHLISAFVISLQSHNISIFQIPERALSKFKCLLLGVLLMD